MTTDIQTLYNSPPTCLGLSLAVRIPITPIAQFYFIVSGALQALKSLNKGPHSPTLADSARSIILKPLACEGVKNLITNMLLTGCRASDVARGFGITLEEASALIKAHQPLK